jgi:hypothetical protein
MRQLYKHNDTWYQVIRPIYVHSVSDKNEVVNMELLKAWRDYLGGDHVLRQNNVFLICETVQEAEYETIND